MRPWKNYKGFLLLDSLLGLTIITGIIITLLVGSVFLLAKNHERKVRLELSRTLYEEAQRLARKEPLQSTRQTGFLKDIRVTFNEGSLQATWQEQKVRVDSEK